MKNFKNGKKLSTSDLALIIEGLNVHKERKGKEEGESYTREVMYKRMHAYLEKDKKYVKK